MPNANKGQHKFDVHTHLPVKQLTSELPTARTTRLRTPQSRTTSAVHPASPTPSIPCCRADRRREGRPHHGLHLCTKTSPPESEASSSMIEEASVLVLVVYARGSLRQPWPTVAYSYPGEALTTTKACRRQDMFPPLETAMVVMLHAVRMACSAFRSTRNNCGVV